MNELIGIKHSFFENCLLIVCLRNEIKKLIKDRVGSFWFLRGLYIVNVPLILD